MAVDLLAELFGEVVDHDELSALLLGHFGEAQQDPDGSIVMRSPTDDRLRIRSAGEKIRSITQGPALKRGELLLLQTKIREELVENQFPGVAVGVAFSLSPIEGSFRAPGDVFQILPPPKTAPQPNVLYAERSFLLEFPIIRSADSLVTLGRRAREAARWSWFLNAVLRERITALGSRRRNAWVICPDYENSPGTIPAPVWGQEFYDIPGLEAYPERLTEGVPPIALIPADEYYSDIGWTGRAVSLPDSLPRSVERYFGLSEKDRVKFERAAHWMFAANDLWESHMSSYYVALVAAAESLAYETLPADPCPTCARDRNQRPTAAFKDFFERYAPGSGSRGDVDALYKVRSGLVHGTALLNHDSPFGGFQFKTSTLKQDQQLRSLSALMTILVVNWLDDHGARGGGE